MVAACLQGFPAYDWAFPSRKRGATTMAHDIDRPDDSSRPRHANSVAEETSATGQRVKGAIKEEVGDMLDDQSMEEKGARENAAGKNRQKKNEAV
jgi:uncharacterized protein YjbJ (UPF0337 family)